MPWSFDLFFFSILNYLTETDYYLWWFADSSMMRLSAEHVSISKTLLCMFCIYLRLQICASTVKRTSVFFGCQISWSLFNLLKVKKCLLLMPSWYVQWHLLNSTWLISQLLILYCPCEEGFRKQCCISSVCSARQLRYSQLFCFVFCWEIQFFGLVGVWRRNRSTVCVCLVNEFLFFIIDIYCQTLSVC